MTREIDDHGPTHHQYEKPLFQSSACGIDRAARVFSVVQYECSSRGGSAKLLIPAIDRSVLFVKPPSLTYTHDETLPRGGDWSIALGPMNDVFFRELLDSMFVSVAQTRIETEGLVVAGEQSLFPDIDGQVRIDLVEYGFLTPQISGLNFFSASTKFRIELGSADGLTLGVCQVVGYGKPKRALSKQLTRSTRRLCLRYAMLGQELQLNYLGNPFSRLG